MSRVSDERARGECGDPRSGGDDAGSNAGGEMQRHYQLRAQGRAVNGTDIVRTVIM